LRKPGSEHLPSYLPARTFALATIDLLRTKVGAVLMAEEAAPPAATSEPAATSKGVEKLGLQELVSALQTRRLTVENAAHQGFVEALELLAEEAKGDLEAFLRNVERWFNETMD